jgi:hypothetical protein
MNLVIGRPEDNLNLEKDILQRRAAQSGKGFSDRGLRLRETDSDIT